MPIGTSTSQSSAAIKKSDESKRALLSHYDIALEPRHVVTCRTGFPIVSSSLVPLDRSEQACTLRVDFSYGFGIVQPGGAEIVKFLVQDVDLTKQILIYFATLKSCFKRGLKLHDGSFSQGRRSESS